MGSDLGWCYRADAADSRAASQPAGAVLLKLFGSCWSVACWEQLFPHLKSLLKIISSRRHWVPRAGVSDQQVSLDSCIELLPFCWIAECFVDCFMWRSVVSVHGWRNFDQVYWEMLGFCLPPWGSAEVDPSRQSLVEKMQIYHKVCCFQYSISNLEGSRVVWAFWNPTLWFEINLRSDQERDARSHPQPGICLPCLSSVCPCSKQTYL